MSDGIDESTNGEKLGVQKEVVMIRCPACRKLNEEDSKFCQECGQKI